MTNKAGIKAGSPKLPGQVVLVMQGGGALGAFQAGVYEGMHEAGMEPDWVVGTSIGAINGALIAGNTPPDRLDRLKEFWEIVAAANASSVPWSAFGLGNLMHSLGAVSSGIPGFFTPNLQALFGLEGEDHMEGFGRAGRLVESLRSGKLRRHRGTKKSTPLPEYWCMPEMPGLRMTDAGK